MSNAFNFDFDSTITNIPVIGKSDNKIIDITDDLDTMNSGASSSSSEVPSSSAPVPSNDILANFNTFSLDDFGGDLRRAFNDSDYKKFRYNTSLRSNFKESSAVSEEEKAMDKLVNKKLKGKAPAKPREELVIKDVIPMHSGSTETSDASTSHTTEPPILVSSSKKSRVSRKASSRVSRKASVSRASSRHPARPALPAPDELSKETNEDSDREDWEVDDNKTPTSKSVNQLNTLKNEIRKVLSLKKVPDAKQAYADLRVAEIMPLDKFIKLYNQTEDELYENISVYRDDIINILKSNDEYLTPRIAFQQLQALHPNVDLSMFKYPIYKMFTNYSDNIPTKRSMKLPKLMIPAPTETSDISTTPTSTPPIKIPQLASVPPTDSSDVSTTPTTSEPPMKLPQLASVPPTDSSDVSTTPTTTEPPTDSSDISTTPTTSEPLSETTETETDLPQFLKDLKSTKSTGTSTTTPTTTSTATETTKTSTSSAETQTETSEAPMTATETEVPEFLRNIHIEKHHTSSRKHHKSEYRKSLEQRLSHHQCEPGYQITKKRFCVKKPGVVISKHDSRFPTSHHKCIDGFELTTDRKCRRKSVDGFKKSPSKVSLGRHLKHHQCEPDFHLTKTRRCAPNTGVDMALHIHDPKFPSSHHKCSRGFVMTADRKCRRKSVNGFKKSPKKSSLGRHLKYHHCEDGYHLTKTRRCAPNSSRKHHKHDPKFPSSHHKCSPGFVMTVDRKCRRKSK